MAKNANAGSTPKIPATSDVQDAQRRAAKAKRRNSKGNGAPSQTLYDGIAADRRERREQKQQAIRLSFFRSVWFHLEPAVQRYGWSAEEISEAHSYLSGLIMSDVQFSCVALKVEREVRKRFALGCVRNPAVTGMAGQSQDWYSEAFESAQAFWNRPKGAPQRELQPA